MIYCADLHSHSHRSDGQYSPAELIRRAHEAGIENFALSDHDSVRGIAEAQAAADAFGIELVPAVEISAGDEPEKDRYDLHILGLFVDPEIPALVHFLDEQARKRIHQQHQQIERFRELGFRIDIESVFSKVVGVPGKPHLVAALLALNPDRGLAERQIYREYLGYGGLAHVPREDEPTSDECIEVIHVAGGLALLAHPLYYRKVTDLDGMVRGLVEAGLDGIEVDCPYELNDQFKDVPGGRPAIVARAQAWVDQYGLVASGGSDFHGGDIGGPLASAGVTREGYEALRARCS